MNENKTKVTAVTPREFLAEVEPEKRRQQGVQLLEFFENR